MKWLIVEDALRDRKGHWLEYVSTFVRGLTALGDEVVVLCDREAEGFILEQTAAQPVLTESIWHRMSDGAGPLKRYLRVPGHALATFFAMRNFFRSFDHGFRGYTRIEAENEAGRRPGSRAGAAFSNPSTSELARDCENTPPNRSAIGPASAALCAADRGSGSDGGNQLADSEEFFGGQSQAGLQMGSQKLHDIREANAPGTSGQASSSVSIRVIRGSNSGETKQVPCSATGPEAQALDSTPALPDWIFVPTVLVHHLLGWWLLIKSGSVPMGSRVLLFFPNLPIQLDDSGRPFWSAGPTTKLMVWLFGQLRQEVESGRVVLGVETHAMRRALESLIGMRVTYLPHPVQAKQAQGESRIEGRESSGTTKDTNGHEKSTIDNTDEHGWENGKAESGNTEKLKGSNWEEAGPCLGKPSGVAFLNPSTSEFARDSENPSLNRSAIDPASALDSGRSALDSKTSAKPIVFGCYGAARWEKGSDVLQAAIRLVLQKAETLKSEKLKKLDARRSTLDSLHFAIQWVEDFRDLEGNLVSIDPWLREHPQVEVIGRYFQGDEYERRLAETDVMVLPYRSPYRLRVSRVVIEAMIHGMPVIATKGTTLFEQAEEYGVVVGCEEGNAASLARAILGVAEGFAAQRETAVHKAGLAAESFSVGYFWELLVNKI